MLPSFASFHNALKNRNGPEQSAGGPVRRLTAVKFFAYVTTGYMTYTPNQVTGSEQEAFR
jgi:hypothetical protein